MKHLTVLSFTLAPLLQLGCAGSGADLPDAGGSDVGTASDATAQDAESTADAASGSSDADVQPPPLVFEPSPPPIPVPDGTRFATIAYGVGEQQVFDAFLPPADAPTPAVLFFHGGGFQTGSRTAGYGIAAALLAAGIALFTADYTLLTPGTETEGARKSLTDARYALQFIRYHSAALAIDPNRIGLAGSSAGAGTSLWLAFHDDMADADSDDPIAREATRPQAVAVTHTQSTYDLLRWAPDVFSPRYPITVDDLLSRRSFAERLVMLYGLPATLVDDPAGLETALRTPEYEAYRRDLDLLAWMSADDPPFYVRNEADDLAPDEPGFDPLHHPLHAQALAERAAEVGLSPVIEAPALALGGDSSAIQFLIDALSP